MLIFFFFSSRRRHTRFSRDWSSDVCSSDLDRSVRSTWDMSGFPVLGRASTFSLIPLASDFSFLSNRDIRRYSRVFSEAAFFVLRVGDEEAEGEDYQGSEEAGGVGGDGVCGAGGGVRSAS